MGDREEWGGAISILSGLLFPFPIKQANENNLITIFNERLWNNKEKVSFFLSKKREKLKSFLFLFFLFFRSH